MNSVSVPPQASPTIVHSAPRTYLLLKTGHTVVVEGMTHSDYKHRRRNKMPIVLDTKEGRIKIEFRAVDRLLNEQEYRAVLAKAHAKPH